jgi:hypothetical protein
MGLFRRKAAPAPPAPPVGFVGRSTPGATDRLVSLGATVYVVADAKVLYVQVFKAACSSMLWAMSQMARMAPEDHGLSRQLHVTRDLTIHDVGLHPVPTIDQVDPELRHEALTSPEWMRVAVVRDPYSRFYSGWESRKLLLHHGPWDGYPQPPLRYVDGLLDVGASFRDFATAASEHRGIWQGDFHFAQQVHVMALDEIDLTDLVTTSDLPDLFRRLGERAGTTVDPGRHNEGLGISFEDVYDAETAAICEDLYAEDFARLGFAHRTFTGPRPTVLDATATAALTMIDERNLRIADLVDAIDRVEAGEAL